MNRLSALALLATLAGTAGAQGQAGRMAPAPALPASGIVGAGAAMTPQQAMAHRDYALSNLQGIAPAKFIAAIAAADPLSPAGRAILEPLHLARGSSGPRQASPRAVFEAAEAIQQQEAEQASHAIGRAMQAARAGERDAETRLEQALEGLAKVETAAAVWNDGLMAFALNWDRSIAAPTLAALRAASRGARSLAPRPIEADIVADGPDSAAVPASGSSRDAGVSAEAELAPADRSPKPAAEPSRAAVPPPGRSAASAPALEPVTEADLVGTFVAETRGGDSTFRARFTLRVDHGVEFTGEPTDYDASSIRSFGGSGAWALHGGKLWMQLKGRALGPDSHAFDDPVSASIAFDLSGVERADLGGSVKARGESDWFGSRDWTFKPWRPAPPTAEASAAGVSTSAPAKRAAAILSRPDVRGALAAMGLVGIPGLAVALGLLPASALATLGLLTLGLAGSFVAMGLGYKLGDLAPPRFVYRWALEGLLEGAAILLVLGGFVGLVLTALTLFGLEFEAVVELFKALGGWISGAL